MTGRLFGRSSRLALGTMAVSHLLQWLRSDPARALSFAALIAFHLAALIIMISTERLWLPAFVYLLGWIFWNSVWIALLARPVMSAALSFICLVTLILLSRFKHEILLMTVNFVDLLLIDRDTFLFMMQVFPKLGLTTAVVGVLLAAALILISFEPLRVGRRLATAVAGGSAVLLIGISAVVPNDPWEEFYAENYFSKYMRSALSSTADLMTRGMLDKAASADTRLDAPSSAPCTVEKPPHIIYIHDESSFDARAIPGIKVPTGYGDYFKSSDGKVRSLLVEGPGGPSWYTEYNVVTGLSARSFGRFVDSATRIAVGRIERGLPLALKRCGYHTHTLYPMYGSFLSAANFQKTAGTETFLDSKDLGARFLDDDAFYFNKAAEVVRDRKGDRPLFLHVYTAQNHFPWTFRFRPDLAKDWKDLGNRADVDEYLRRQHLTEVDYKAFLARLTTDFPTESFLIVRFGDHQPYFARHLIDPGQNDSMLVRRVAAGDPRFLKTYYAIDTIRFAPRNLSTSLDLLDAPYLPLALLDLAGVPLDPSFVEQKKILARCNGLFFRCNSGEEARRFNRLLIDAGFIKGL
jgi:hypothetical protein